MNINNSERVELKYNNIEPRFYSSILSGLEATPIFLPRIAFGAIRVYPFQGFF